MTNGDFVEKLKMFNRKERFWVVQEALGTQSLSCDFRNRLGYLLGVDVPKEAYWAIDYHFDWIAGAFAEYKNLSGSFPNSEPNKKERLVQGNQEDIDLLIAFCDRLVLVEAKAAGAWDNEQLASKIKRVQALKVFFEANNGDCSVKINFLLLSPDLPQKLSSDSSKILIEINGWKSDIINSSHISLTSFRGPFKTVERCDENGLAPAKGDRWRTKVIEQ